MAFDGSHAFITGDYVTPSEGPYSGQLGPWAGLVSAAGVPPRSAAMKSTFIVYGFVWLACCVPFVLRRPWAWRAMLALAIGSLWYLVVGTVTSTLLIGLLMAPPLRRAFSSRDATQ